MYWCIDLGNTAAKVACFDSGSIKEEHRFLTDNPASFVGWVEKQPEAEACIVSNVGKDQPILYAVLRSRAHYFLELKATTPVPVRIDYETPDSLGKDRLAAVVGASVMYPGADILVIDAGTAITLDLLTAGGIYQGGVISPGVQTRFKALHEYTSRLPMGSIVPPVPFPARNTQDAVNAGVIQGVIYELDAYIDTCRTKNPTLKVLLTGGDAIFFADQLKNRIFVVSNLVFIGLHRILQYNASC